jgi:aldehyde dehydrogenase (NAD+)
MKSHTGLAEKSPTRDQRPPEDIKNCFLRLRAHSEKTGASGPGDRVRRLKVFKQTLLRHQEAIRQALRDDFGKHALETDMSEILPVTDEIHLAVDNLRRWMRGRDVGTPLLLVGTRSHIEIQPKGVVLILSPWNFPFNLTFVPLVSAIAAGNTVMLKPSEHTPHSSRVMETIIKEAFSDDEVVLIQGGIATANALLDLPFNHIFFTGSPAVGKIVMAKAAKHLSSVTLELGGKSPAIIDRSADIKLAARRVALGKVLNAGQICIAPDYILVHREVQAAFLEALSSAFDRMCGVDPVHNPDLARIINDKHFERLTDLLHTATAAGAHIHYGGTTDPASRYIHPTILTDLPSDHALLDEEIFGPLLPVIPFDDPAAALAFIRARPKPLSLYIFAKDKKTQRYYVDQTRAGTTCINTLFLQFMNNELPFGGDNNSGIGKAHGYHGFLAFSNERAVLRQVLPITAPDIVAPPYRPWVQKLIGFFTRTHL